MSTDLREVALTALDLIDEVGRDPCVDKESGWTQHNSTYLLFTPPQNPRNTANSSTPARSE